MLSIFSSVSPAEGFVECECGAANGSKIESVVCTQARFKHIPSRIVVGVWPISKISSRARLNDGKACSKVTKDETVGMKAPLEGTMSDSPEE